MDPKNSLADWIGEIQFQYEKPVSEDKVKVNGERPPKVSKVSTYHGQVNLHACIHTHTLTHTHACTYHRYSSHSHKAGDAIVTWLWKHHCKPCEDYGSRHPCKSACSIVSFGLSKVKNHFSLVSFFFYIFLPWFYVCRHEKPQTDQK